MRIVNSLVFFLFFLSSNAQIEISEFDPLWKSRTDSALSIIKECDSSRYHFLQDNCTMIHFWIFDFSSIVENGTILIPQVDVKYESVSTLASVIVKESMRLNILNNLINMNEGEEEMLCLTYQLDFLLRVPEAEPEVIEDIRERLSNYWTNKKSQE